MLEIRPLPLDRFDLIWPIIETVVRGGDTYALPQDLERKAALRLWSEPGRRIYAAWDDGELLGTYYLRPNQPGPGSHVANAGFMTSSSARGRGVARQMCLHSLQEAARLGYRAMQFNFVVSSNTGAVRLWLSLGFSIVGRLPEAFRLPSGVFVDALVMHKPLPASEN